MAEPLFPVARWLDTLRWGPTEAAEATGLNRNSIARMRDGAPVSLASAALCRDASRQIIAELAPFAAWAPGETVAVAIRLPEGDATLQAALPAARRLLAGGVLDLDDAGRLIVRAGAEAEALALLHAAAAADSGVPPWI